MPLTTRRALGAIVSALAAAGIVAASALGAAADPRPDRPTVTPAASAEVTPGVGPVSVAVVVPIVVPPTTTGLLSAEELEQYTGPTGGLTRQLDAVAGTRATLAVDPMIVASIRVLGTEAPASAVSWLARLEALSNESFLLAYGDADVLTAARTGTLDVLSPAGFGFALDPARFAEQDADDEATAAPSPSPSATAAPDPDAAPLFPSTEQVLAWSTDLPAIVWPHGTGVGSDDVAAFAAVGTGAVLLSDADTGDAGSAHAVIDGVDALVIDAERSSALRSAVSTFFEGDRTAQITAIVEDLAGQAAATPGRSFVLAIDRGWPATVTGLAESLAAIELAETSQVVRLSEVLAAPATPVSLGEGVRDADREAVFTGLIENAAAEQVFSSVVVEPSLLLEPRRLARIALYSGSWIGDPTWTDAVDAFRERSDEIVSSIAIERGSDLVLLARNTELRVSVSNALDLPITVRVSVDARSPIVRIDGPVDLVVEPNSTASAYLPVEAIANGDVRVLAALHSPSGVQIDSGFSNISVRAEWETLGTLVFVLVLVAVFAAGIVRLIIRRRKARRAAEGGGTDGAEAGSEAAAAEGSGD